MSKPMTKHAFFPLFGLPLAAALTLGASVVAGPAAAGMDHGATGGMSHEGMSHKGMGREGMGHEGMGHGDMGQMMQKMMGAMAMSADERIAALKTTLKITDAQGALWKPFAAALQDAGESMHHIHHHMLPPEPAAAPAPGPAAAPAREIIGDKDYPGATAIKKMGGDSPAPAPAAGAPAADGATTLPARLAHFEEELLEHVDILKKIKAALDPLYASFSDEQKKIADGLIVGPMGAM